MADALYLVYYALVLIFGITLAFAFSGAQFNKRNVCLALVLFSVSGLIQLALYFSYGSNWVWAIYPLIAHSPTLLVLCLACRKRLATALASIATAYLFCQPSRWFGLVLQSLIQSALASAIAQSLCLITVGFVSVLYLAGYFSQIFAKEDRSIYILASIPMVYYLYDYAIGIYGGLWLTNSQLAVESLPFFVCIIYVVFALFYYKEYEQRADAERNERMIRFVVEQQTHEMEAILRSERETRILRHDMRLFLNNLSVCMENDPEAARKMIASYSDSVETAAVKRYCSSTVINCVLSSFEAQCREADVDFRATVAFDQLTVDEITFASILSNGLDNALNAQKALPAEKRFIQLMLKQSNDRLLLSIKNPFSKMPEFVDGRPVSSRAGHGYGTQSICLLTERMGGKCQFAIENQLFLLRVILPI